MFAVAGKVEERDVARLSCLCDRFAGFRAEIEIEHGEIDRRRFERGQRLADVGGGRHDRSQLGQTCFKVEADQRIIFDEQDPQVPQGFSSIVRAGHIDLFLIGERAWKHLEGPVCKERLPGYAVMTERYALKFDKPSREFAHRWL